MPSSPSPQRTAPFNLRPSRTVPDHSAKVLILGLGDVGRRIAFGLARHSNATEIVLAGRSRARGEALARLVAAATPTPTRFIQVDGLNQDAVCGLLAGEAPD
ncbi:MAG TPA: saccharopine dehydrogenase NADP-binding domain-containing protein, partial [Duganella sp.]|nr:saccharopine dehydrogenase NADP-binding domain-containing protein [Duganella sp.]